MTWQPVLGQMKRHLPYPLRAAIAVTALTVFGFVSESARAEDSAACRHAISLIGSPKMAADFKNFDWVNPDAPKGGTLRQAEIGTFDSLNGFTINGSAAEGLGLVFDSLFTTSLDEPSTSYGLVAQCISFPADYSSATFRLRPEAKFHDGTPIRPEDVVASLTLLKSANPQSALYYRNVVGAEKTGDNEVTFKFDKPGNRELPQITSELPVFPEKFWSGKSANGEARDITKSTLEPPLGSGPYKIKSFEAGRSIVYERVQDYWAKDLPVQKGQWNFDQIRYEYFRDRLPAFEAFKSGSIDTWQESVSSAWATAYDIDAVKNGLIKKELLPHQRVAGMQSFTFNLRRKQFTDVRVRQAFNLAMDFEELNRKIFFGAYTRLSSYFDNSELKSQGVPAGKELEILNEVRDSVPPEVFTTEWKNPQNKTPDDVRAHLKEALKLLQTAGWSLKGGALVNAAGEQLTAEILLAAPEFDRVAQPLIENLKKIGVAATVRLVEGAQYERRLKDFDFDIVVNSVGQSLSPGNEQRFFFGSEAAGRPGSRNVAGIQNPAVDKLIDKIVFAKDREELVAATRALDRVLLRNYYVIPNWFLPFERLASWDLFGRAEKLPSQVPARVLQTWWYDPDKAKKIEAARK